nr:membrane protein insertase YidC [Burkholderiaceae bacterium]
MTDMRRTLLWVVFTMSLVLIWDAWNKHTGQASIFGGAPPPAVTAGADPARPSSAAAGVPAPAAVPTPAAATPGAVATLPTPAQAAPAGEVVTVTTDVFKATFSSQGGTLIQLELLGFRDHADPGRNVLLLDQSAKRLYVAQTGLISTQAGVSLPNHLTPMTLVPGERTLAPAAQELTVRFEATGASGVTLAKTYTFRRGEYTIGVRHELGNAATEPVTPQLYLQLARDGNPPEGESSFYFTFTGPAVYTDAGKFQKVDFKDIAKGDASHAKS